MNWNTRKNLMHRSALAILFLFLLLPVAAFFLKTPACTDGKKNGDEKGIDCGGICARACSFETTPPVVEWVRPFSVTKNVWSAAAFVRNPNLNFSGVGEYLLRLYDEGGILVYERRGEVFLPAGKSLPIFEGGMNIGNLLPSRASLSFQDDIAWIRDERGASFLPTGTIEWRREDGQSFVSVEVQNETNTDKKNVPVTVLVSGGDGNIFAASKTILPALPKRSSQTAAFTWPFLFSADPARIEAFAVDIQDE